MKTAELDYDLPPELIAQEPLERRDASRLMVLERASRTIRHARFDELQGFMPAGALLVFNNTRVLPARLSMHRGSGGGVQGLFLQESSAGTWEMMLTGGRRLKIDELLAVDGSDQRLRLLERLGEGVWRVEPVPAGSADSILARCGSAPLPPYIHRDKGGTPGQDRDRDLSRYQTVYARRPGAVAAPTAGLHFTPELLAELSAAGFESAFVTLHVGVGTFAPIRVDDLADHSMHCERYECPPETADAVNQARRQGRPVLAVGTTSVRVLETCAGADGSVAAGSGSTRIFIYPPYRYRAVDAMITNFHLPGSTLLALVFAFAGRDYMLEAYREAVRSGYRFFSYGDAMLIR